MRLHHLSTIAVLALGACTSTDDEPDAAAELARSEPAPELGNWYAIYLESLQPVPASYARPPLRASGVGASGGSGYSTRIYDVSDLLAGVAHYSARDVGDLRRNEDQPGYGEPRVAERVAFLDEDQLLDMIRQSVAPGTWDDPGVSLEIRGGKLIVRHRR